MAFVFAFVRPVQAIFIATLSALALATGAVPAARANPLAPVWTGAYFGINGGANWADVDISNLGRFDASTATVGAHLGYNFALGNLVIGIEGDGIYDGSDLSFTTGGGGSGNFETEWSGTLRGRLGFTAGPVLLYATAGYAWTEATVTQRSAAGIESSASGNFNGVVYGAGIEGNVLPNISLRLEALRFDYGTEELSFRGGAAAAQDFDPADTVVRAGVTFHLN
jgi:outer membrane immunogenic protein